MDRRPLAALLALGLMGAVPVGAAAASTDELLAQAPNGTLSESPAEDLIAQTPKGTLSETPKASGSTRSGGSSSTAAAATATTATALPYTGSDPRITLSLGLAAVLMGAGLRLRTRDARDF